MEAVFLFYRRGVGEFRLKSIQKNHSNRNGLTTRCCLFETVFLVETIDRTIGLGKLLLTSVEWM